jgi:hypothetical protein
MDTSGKRLAEHQEYRREAEERYKFALNPNIETKVWSECLQKAAAEVEEVLAATNNLKQLPEALKRSGRYTRTLRFLTGPPLSQDQFQLACPDWRKSNEKTGRPLSDASAAGFEMTFRAWVDGARTKFLDNPIERAKAVQSTAILIAQQEFATRKRMRLAGVQEEMASTILTDLGFTRISIGFVDQPGSLEERQFARACQFATADGSSHEVDLAIGLSGRRILALECKVSNDKTNSVKRVNDVLKKAAAWRSQWGKFVITGALLEGVLSEKEPRRLLEAEVEVFWSHRPELFREWLESEITRLEE